MTAAFNFVFNHRCFSSAAVWLFSLFKALWVVAISEYFLHLMMATAILIHSCSN